MGGIAKNVHRLDLFNKVGRLALKSGKFVKRLGYAGIALEAVISFASAIKNGTDLQRTITDTITDVAIGAGIVLLSSSISGALIGSLAGSAIPIVGNVIGFVVGFIVGIGVSLIDYYLPQIRQGIKDIVYMASVGVEDFINKISDFFRRLFA